MRGNRGPLLSWWAVCRLASKRSIDRGAGDGKNLGQIADGIVSGVIHPAQLFLLAIRQFRLFTTQLSSGSRERHALSCPHPDQVCCELGEGREDIEEQLAHRVGWIMDAAPDL